MPTPDEQVIQDGQRAVAVTEVSGDFIYDGGATDPYCIVDNNGTAQRALKVANVGEGGGGATVDQTYDPTSTNAQSGTAVAEAVAPALKNTATGSDSASILGRPATQSNAVNLGIQSYAYQSNSVAIGYKSTAGSQSIAIGSGVSGGGNNHRGCIGIGGSASSGDYSIAIGGSAFDGNNTVIGGFAEANRQAGIAIGYQAKVGKFAVAGSGENSIQIGTGTNLEQNTMCIGFSGTNYKLLDGNTGKIPMARLPIVQLTQADYDALVSGGTVDANTIYCIIPA